MQKFIVTVDDHSTIISVADKLHAAGMEITSILPNIGIISGKFEQDKVKELYIDGVIDVELDENKEVQKGFYGEKIEVCSNCGIEKDA